MQNRTSYPAFNTVKRRESWELVILLALHEGVSNDHADDNVHQAEGTKKHQEDEEDDHDGVDLHHWTHDLGRPRVEGDLGKHGERIQSEQYPF